MPANWRRIPPAANGATPRPDAPPLAQGSAGPAAAAGEWEKLFTPVAPRYREEDLVVADSVREQLDNALALVRHHNVVYRDWGLSAKDPQQGGLALNLFGPPGTGKSLAAEVVAARLGRGLIIVRYSELISKYVGDTPKTIAALFRAAERHQAVLVFNEADAVLSSRLQQLASSADKASNEAVAELLTALERHRGVVIFTTNLLGNYDEAFLRRIIAHVRFDLPDLPGREQIWRQLLPKAVPLAADVTCQRLAEATDGLAGGDVLQVVRLALAKAAARSGAAGPVLWEDFALPIARERAAKEAHRRGGRWSETPVEPAQLPALAKASFDRQANAANANGHGRIRHGDRQEPES